METSELENPSMYHHDVQPECHQEEAVVHHEVEYGVALEATFDINSSATYDQGQQPPYRPTPYPPPHHYPPPHSPHVYHPPPIGTEAWRTGLFDCMEEPDNAVTTALMPCVTFGQIAEVVDDGNTTCATSGLLYGLVAAFSGMPCIVSCAYRTKIRNRYGLVEAPASDCLTHLFCEPCSLCQEYRELQRRGIDPSRGWQGNAAASGMSARPHMTPPMMTTHRMI